MPIGQWQWVTLAEGLPPTLVTNAPETALKPNETPSATGLDVTSDGWLKTGSIPSGTAANLKQYSVGGYTYDWYYNRMWRLSGNSLVFGAPRYNATYFRQASGSINFNDESTTWVKLLPIGGTGLILLKSTGGLILPSANDPAGRFPPLDFMQEAKITTANHAVELDGVVYFCNSDGVFSVDISGKVEEISYPIRGTITPAALTCDYKAKYLIVGTTHCYDTVNKRWFKYSSTTFYYESPRLRSPDSAPIAVRAVAFDIKWASGTTEDAGASIEFATQVEDREWSPTFTLQTTYNRGQHANVSMRTEPDNARDFKLKITSLSSTLSIKRIAVEVSGFTAESRDT